MSEFARKSAKNVQKWARPYLQSDETTMPQQLRKAHKANGIAVMQAYGFDVKTATENSCVAELMKKYVELTKEI